MSKSAIQSQFLLPFWHPLTHEERVAEEMRTREFLGLLAEGEYERALRRFQRFEPPPAVLDAFTSDPVVLRLLVYTFHPRRSDPETWPRLRLYVTPEREPRYLIGLQPALLAEGVPLKWGELVTAIYYAIDYAQRSQERGDTRPFKVLVDEFRGHYFGTAETTDEGNVEIMRMLLVGGGAVESRLLTRSDGSQREEVVFDVPYTVSDETFREYVDQTIIRRIQQFAASPEDCDSFFSPPPDFERVMKLMCNDELIVERPMHLTTNYAGLVAKFARHYVFERRYNLDAETGGTKRASDRVVSHQEVLSALFEVAIAYKQDFGCVPGVLASRMRGILTGRVRDKGVSRERNGRRQLIDQIEHSGDTLAEQPAGLDEATESNTLLATDTEGNVHLAREGARTWADDGVSRVTRRELLEPLTEEQRALALLLMNDMSQADAARALGVSSAAVSQMLKRMRAVLDSLLNPAE